MEAIEDHELLTINGGRHTDYYGGGGCIYFGAKMHKAVTSGDSHRNRMKQRRAKWNSRGGNYRW